MELGTLFRGRFLDPQTGALAEFFTDDWARAPGEAGRLVEPGHQFEWAWILSNLQRLCGVDATYQVRALVDFGESARGRSRHGRYLQSGERQRDTDRSGVANLAEHRAHQGSGRSSRPLRCRISSNGSRNPFACCLTATWRRRAPGSGSISSTKAAGRSRRPYRRRRFITCFSPSPKSSGCNRPDPGPHIDNARERWPIGAAVGRILFRCDPRSSLGAPCAFLIPPAAAGYIGSILTPKLLELGHDADGPGHVRAG